MVGRSIDQPQIIGQNTRLEVALAVALYSDARTRQIRRADIGRPTMPDSGRNRHGNSARAPWRAAIAHLPFFAPEYPTQQERLARRSDPRHAAQYLVVVRRIGNVGNHRL